MLDSLIRYLNGAHLLWLVAFMALLAIYFMARKKPKLSSHEPILTESANDPEPDLEQLLDKLRAAGAEVISDIRAKNFTLDHVVIHTSGAYMIVTHELPLPESGQAKVTFDGRALILPERRPLEEPINPVRAQAAWLRHQLHEAVKKTMPVKGVLLLPGWTVASKQNLAESQVWVLNPRAMTTFVMGGKAAIRTEDVALAKSYLQRYVKTKPD